MSALSESLAADVTVGYDRAFADGVSCELPIAEAILASPEMQAIRTSLLRLTDRYTEKTDRDVVLRRSGLPKHVVEWVLS